MVERNRDHVVFVARLGLPYETGLACFSYEMAADFQSGDPGQARQSHKIVSTGEHVVERAERVHVVAIEALALDPPEHVGEIDIARTRVQMDLVAVTKAIGEAHFFDPVDIEGVDKAGDPLRNEMCVIDGKRQFESRRSDRVEIIAPLLDRMREVVNLRLVRLLVQVFEQDQRTVPLGMTDNPL